MTKSAQDIIKDDFKAKKTKDKHYLISALVALIGTFMPWFSGSMGYFSVSVSGWNSWGYLAVIASISILALYILPFFKVKLPTIFKDKIQEQKILSGALIASPIIWIFQIDFKLSLLGIGFYVTTIAAGYMLFLVHKK